MTPPWATKLTSTLGATRKLIWTLAVRELISMFRVPAGWIIIALFAFLSGVLFVNQTLIPGQPGSMRYFFTASAWLLIPIAPAISMKLMAEEYRTGSFESLRTTPAGDWAVAIGKYLGSIMFLGLMLTPSLIYPIVLGFVSDPMPDPGPIVAGYLMLVLVGSLYLAIGLLASSLTSSQTLAFLGTMMALVIFMVITSVLVPNAGAFGPVLQRLSVISRAAELGKGVIDTATIAFFVIFSAWMVVLTAGVLESHRLARSKWTMIVMAAIFVSTTGLAAFFAGVLTNTHHHRIDVTSTSDHKLSPRAKSMVAALPGKTQIVLALNQPNTDRLALDLVSDVLDTYARASGLLDSQIIDLASAQGQHNINALLSELRSREIETITKNASTLTQVAQSIQEASAQLQSTSAELQTIQAALDPADPSTPTNRAFFDQRSALVRIAAQDLDGVARSLQESLAQAQDSDDLIRFDELTQTPKQLISTLLLQLEDLAKQVEAFSQSAQITPLTPIARVTTGSLKSRLSTLIEDLAITLDDLTRLPVIDANRVAKVLQTGEALLVIGPPESGITAVDLDTLLPSTQVLQDAGISPAGVIGPRAQELIATALGQLVIQSHPIVVLIHPGQPGELLATPNLLTKVADRFNQQGIDTLEWAALHQTDHPNMVNIDPLGQRPVVYILLTADSSAGSGTTGITGSQRATALAQIATRLIDAGKPLLISMSPSIFSSFGDTDPLTAALEPLGIVPDPSLTLLTLRSQGTKSTADPATLVVPSASPHPVGNAVAGLTTVLPWSIPITLDPRVGVEASPIIVLSGSENLWAERDWLAYWSTPAQSRQFLQKQPAFDESSDLRRDQWILAAGAQRAFDSDIQRLIVVGSNSWIYDALTFGQGQLVDGRITTAFPGNMTLLESSIAWLAGLDELIAPGTQARPIATIGPLQPSTLSTLRWLLLAGVPGLVILLGIGFRIIFG